MPGSQCELAARLLVEGALPTIRGDASGPPVAPGRILSPEERDRLSLPNSGMAFVYAQEAGEPVFAHLLGSNADIFFYGGETVNGLAVVDGALKKAGATQTDDIKHPQKPGLRSREYRVDFPNDRVALIEVVYPTERDQADKGFWIRARANQRSQ